MIEMFGRFAVLKDGAPMIELEARYGGRRHFEQCTRDAFYHRIRRMERILREADIPFALLARYQGGLVQIVARR